MSVGGLTAEGERILDALYTRNLIRVWPRDNVDGWTLHSNIWSPFYVDLRGISALDIAQGVLSDIGTAFSSIVQKHAPQINRLVGVATGGIPVAIAATMVSGIPSCYTRRVDMPSNGGGAREDVKAWGEARFLEGELRAGDKILLVDDLITDGSSKLAGLEAITREAERRKISVECRDVAVILDRGQGGAERLKALGVKLHSLIDLKTNGMDWLEGKMSPGEVRMIRAYLDRPLAFANKEERGSLRKLLN